MAIRRIHFINAVADKHPEFNNKELYAMIICGEVSANGETIRDPRQKISSDSSIKLKQKQWVSRGGEKLSHCLKEWGIDPSGKIILDAGSSTGGFTDCLLQNGAERVHSVDVGMNQLDYRLRSNGRVNVLERTNIMSVASLDPKPDMAVADLSFRSISGAAPHIISLTAEKLLIVLIKPQFEVEPYDGFDGVIRDNDKLKSAVESTAENLESEGVLLLAVMESPVKGHKGNTEYFFKLTEGAAEKGTNKRVIDDFYGKSDLDRGEPI
jgi:23S rRNA (cytidine1920-2'-O)/16S rRNA (cytidine1409-2'-O)-methyltransferase